jgi:hypothetical protein
MEKVVKPEIAILQSSLSRWDEPRVIHRCEIEMRKSHEKQDICISQSISHISSVLVAKEKKMVFNNGVTRKHLNKQSK